MTIRGDLGPGLGPTARFEGRIVVLVALVTDVLTWVRDEWGDEGSLGFEHGDSEEHLTMKGDRDRLHTMKHVYVG